MFRAMLFLATLSSAAVEIVENSPVRVREVRLKPFGLGARNDLTPRNATTVRLMGFRPNLTDSDGLDMAFLQRRLGGNSTDLEVVRRRWFFKKIKKGFNKIGDWTKEAVKDVGNWAKEAGKDVAYWTAEAVNDVGDWAVEAVDDIGDWTEEAFVDAGEWVAYAAEDALEGAVVVFEGAGDFIVDTWEAIEDAAIKYGNCIGRAFKKGPFSCHDAEPTQGSDLHDYCFLKFGDAVIDGFTAGCNIPALEASVTFGDATGEDVERAEIKVPVGSSLQISRGILEKEWKEAGEGKLKHHLAVGAGVRFGFKNAMELSYRMSSSGPKFDFKVPGLGLDFESETVVYAQHSEDPCEDNPEECRLVLNKGKETIFNKAFAAGPVPIQVVVEAAVYIQGTPKFDGRAQVKVTMGFKNTVEVMRPVTLALHNPLGSVNSIKNALNFDRIKNNLKNALELGVTGDIEASAGIEICLGVQLSFHVNGMGTDLDIPICINAKLELKASASHSAATLQADAVLSLSPLEFGIQFQLPEVGAVIDGACGLISNTPEQQIKKAAYGFIRKTTGICHPLAKCGEELVQDTCKGLGNGFKGLNTKVLDETITLVREQELLRKSVSFGTYAGSSRSAPAPSNTFGLASGCKGISLSEDGQCFETSGSHYSNRNDCTIMVNKETTLHIVGTFEVESHSSCGFDYIRVNGREYCGSDGPSGVTVTAGASMRWYTDSSVVKSGFKICSDTKPAKEAVVFERKEPLRLSNDVYEDIPATRLGSFGHNDFTIEFTWRGTAFHLTPDGDYGALFIRTGVDKPNGAPYTGPSAFVWDDGRLNFRLRSDDALECPAGTLKNPTSTLSRNLKFTYLGGTLQVDVDGIVKCTRRTTLLPDLSLFRNAPLRFGGNHGNPIYQNLNGEISNLVLTEAPALVPPPQLAGELTVSEPGQSWFKGTGTLGTYIGCGKNQGSARVNGHVLHLTYEQCRDRAISAEKTLFGMEHPQGSSTTGKAQCLILNSEDQFHKMERAYDSECAAEGLVNGRRLGSANRLAVYSLVPQQTPLPDPRRTTIVRIGQGPGNGYIKTVTHPVDVQFHAFGNGGQYCEHGEIYRGQQNPAQCRDACAANSRCQYYVTYEHSHCDRCIHYTHCDNLLPTTCGGTVRTHKKVGGSHVVCPSLVSKSNWEGGHTYDDFFAITVKGDRVTATRLDSQSWWGVDLRFKCFVVESYTVEIGPSSNNRKTVTLPISDLACPREVNKSNWITPNWRHGDVHGDEFEVTVAGRQVTARRTDENNHWGMPLKFKCSMPKYTVIIGSSGGNTKSIQVPHTHLVCSSLVSKINWLGGDTSKNLFVVVVSGNTVTVKRVDKTQGWSMNLQFECHYSPSYTVVVGPSGHNSKSVTVPFSGLRCESVVHRENWLGGYQYKDQIAVTVSGTRVTARRIDSNRGWGGMNLKFKCYWKTVVFAIGPSSENTKAVYSSMARHLACPSMVNKYNWLDGHTHQDTFAITVSTSDVSAKRMDRSIGWGMNLRFPCYVPPTYKVVVGHNRGGGSVKRITVPHSDLVCPPTVDKTNWITSVTHGDVFKITVEGDQITAWRVDRQEAWTMSLEFDCFFKSL